MSQENVEVVRRGYDAWNRGDMNAHLALYSSDARVYPLEDFADSQIRHGLQEIRRLFAELREPWERDEIEAKELVAAGDYVVADNLWRGVMKGTGDEVEMRVGIAFLLRDGKVAEFRLYRSFDEALEAAGLSE